jgi:putative ABC transport system substrate-binding protein
MRQLKEIEQRAHALGLEVLAFEATNAETLNRALEDAVARKVGALLVSVEALIVANRAAIIEFAARNRLPVMYSAADFVDDGGLVAYGVHYPDLYFRAASYVDKICKGAKAGDLPIEQPTRFELVINLKTAKALGINIPRDVLLRADKVIQ